MNDSFIYCTGCSKDLVPNKIYNTNIYRPVLDRVSSQGVFFRFFEVYFSDSLIYTSLDQIRFRRSDMLIQNFQISSECDKLVLLRIFQFLFIFSQNKHQIQLTHYMSAYTSKRYSYSEKKTWMLFCLFCILMIETYVYTYWPIHR